MKITEISLNRHVAVFLMTFILIAVGLNAYLTLPREAAPDITIPFVFVATPYFGVSPGDMETLVTQPIEKELQGVEDVKEIRSSSSEGLSSITIEFETDVDIDDALQKVREKVDLAKSELPSDVEEPIIQELNFSQLPIMTVNVSGSIGLVQLKELAEDLQDKIEAIPGVLEVDLLGGLEREVQVNVDPERLQYYNLALDDIIGVIRDENINIPGGTIDIGRYKYLLRAPGEFEVTDIINDLVITSFNNRAVYMRDVAEVNYGFKDPTSHSRQERVECVSLSISKRTGENLLDISNKIKETLKEDEKRLPADVTLTVTGDSSEMVQDLVNELDNTVITGLILVLIVLLFSLDLRIAVIVSIAIPLSMLITFFVVQIIGWTLNFVVLFALILALGMLVDDAIVVCENIYRFVEEGYDLIEAARLGTQEVAIPVITATSTIMAAFLPLAFWPGIVGEFMKFLPITVIIALAASLFVALTINPAFSSRFLKIPKGHHVKKSYIDIDPEELPKFMQIYRQIIIGTLKHPLWTLFTSFLLFVFIIFLFGIFNAGIEFFPSTDPDQIFVNVEAPTGTNLETTDQIVRQIEDEIKEFEDVEIFVANVGVGTDAFDANAGEGGPSNKAQVLIEMVDRPDRHQSSVITMDQIRERILDIPGAIIEIEKEENGPPTGAPINIEISGDDFDVLGELSEKIRYEIRDVPGIVDLKDDFISGKPEIKIQIDREKATLYGLSTAQIASTLRTAINGTEASQYRVGEDEYDITVRLKEDRRNAIDDIREIRIAAQGAQIPLETIATIETAGGLGSITRKDLRRVVTVTGEVAGRNSNEALAEVQEKLANFPLPSGYLMEFTGESEDQKEAQDFLSKAFVITVLLILFVLVAEFNSFKIPILVMSGVIMSIAGVFIGLMIVQIPFGIVMTGVGVISLAGVVVRNGIVLLDYVIILREKGLNRFDSLVVGGMTRFRPVFLTAFTTILGLLPTAIGVSFDFKNFEWIIGGEMGQFWKPLAVSVISGLTFATVLTLVILPVMFHEWENLELKIGKMFGKKTEEDEETPEIETVSESS